MNHLTVARMVTTRLEMNASGLNIVFLHLLENTILHKRQQLHRKKGRV